MSVRFIALGLSLVVFSFSLNAEEVSVDGQIQQLELSVANLPKIKVDLVLRRISAAIWNQTKVYVFPMSTYNDDLRVLKVVRRYRMNAELAGVKAVFVHPNSKRNECKVTEDPFLACDIRTGSTEEEILSLFQQSYGVLASTSDEEWMDILKQVALEIENTGKTKQRIGKKD